MPERSPLIVRLATAPVISGSQLAADLAAMEFTDPLVPHAPPVMEPAANLLSDTPVPLSSSPSEKAPAVVSVPMDVAPMVPPAALARDREPMVAVLVKLPVRATPLP